MLLLDNVAIATGADTKVAIGRYMFSAWGTSIGAATITLQRKMPNGAYLPVSPAATMTAFGNAVVDLPGGAYRVVTTSGGAAPVGVYAALDNV